MQSSLAFILHSRPYKETSALMDVLTPTGRVRAVLRGARGKLGSVARPFSVLDIELRGRTELKTISRIEPAGEFNFLQGQALFCGMYLNELLVRLLPLNDPQPVVFEHYGLTLQGLAHALPIEPLLRTFEWRLLEQLGYGFSFAVDNAGQALQAQMLYRLVPESGFEAVFQQQPGVFLGADILALAAVDWQQAGILHTAKRLMRQALAAHLGGRPLMSRELFLVQKGSV
ncbi:MAG: DNA repair protein RecO [Pseudomonas sp.]|jgi:DNA repair protein RecO (recombination protein O)|nr:DNA repair protein RecO [Pseudomonas sp.]MDD2222515.1 DNA repair protein RecO [Pseudomonas sp.]MDY0414418.1 DNA repair protein RecO [Pseudomonas sp.]